MKNCRVLVLGVQGMLGHTVYSYLSKKFPRQVWGTTRQGFLSYVFVELDSRLRGNDKRDNPFFKLSVETTEDDIAAIVQKLGHIDYIINCIALVRNAPEEKMVQVNVRFPHVLEHVSEKYKSRCIHVSTDAVFGSLAGEVTESSLPSPQDTYGKTKLAGELSAESALTIRTSLLGFDPYKHTGLLEWAMNQKIIPGYTNHLWSGCTTVQFADLIEKIIYNNMFIRLRGKSPIYHFAPLLYVSKYDIVKEFFSVIKKNVQVIPTVAEDSVNRQLITKYPESLWYTTYTHNMREALKELVEFEKNEK